MGFLEAVQSGFRRGLDYRGRSSRSEYWWFHLAGLLLELGWLIVGILLGPPLRGVPFLWTVVTIVVTVLYICLIFCSIALLVRRLHDSDRSAWWLLVAFVPLLNLIFFLLVLITKGDQGPNRYGPPSGYTGSSWPPDGHTYGSPYGRTVTAFHSPAQPPMYGTPPPTYSAPPSTPYDAPPPPPPPMS